MAKGRIGFSHGAPENPETIWQKKLGDTTVSYTKICVGADFLFITVNAGSGTLPQQPAGKLQVTCPRTRLNEYPGLLISLQGE
jgi:hypothetical protein